MQGNEKSYRTIFWVGYLLVFTVACIPLKVNLHKTTLNLASFKFHLDQILHAIVYFLICLYFLAGKFLGLRLFNGNSFIKFLIIVLVLAIITEIVQIFIPMRAFNFFDLIANIIGICFGVVIIKIVKVKEPVTNY
jgi:VanZ family protein